MGSPESGSRRFVLRRSHRLLGISIPESGSGQLALRRSFRLLGKPAMNVPQLSDIKPRKPRKPSKPSKPLERTCIPCKPLKRTGIYRKLTSAEIMRHNLESTVFSFLSCQEAIGAYPCGDVEKTCIHPDGKSSWVETDKSTGFSWVAVHGIDSICAVFKKDKDAALRAYSDPKCATAFYHEIGFTAISEMADLVDEKPTLTKPFAVVCATSGTANVHEVSSAVPNKEADDFLQDKIGSGLPFTIPESIETAIGAFQLVCKQKFKAADIWVSVWHWYNRDFLFNKEIEKHLANINRPGNGVYIEEEHLAGINRSGSGGCIEEHLADISGPDSEGLTEEHLPVINKPDSGGLGNRSPVGHTLESPVESMI